MKTNSEILEKLRKILTLANDRGAQPGEVEAAMAKAKELAIRHSIELASIDLEQDEKAASAIEIEKDMTTIRSKYKQPYHRWVYQTIRSVFEVHIIESSWSSPGGVIVSKITFVGEKTDVAIAKAIFPYLEKIFPATCNRLVSAGQFRYCAATANGCYAGIYSGLLEANRREEAKLSKQEHNKYALVVRKKDDMIVAKMKEFFPHMHTPKVRSMRRDSTAVMLGYQEGRKINLSQLK